MFVRVCIFMFITNAWVFVCVCMLVSELWKCFRKSTNQWIVGAVSASWQWSACLTPTYLLNTAWQIIWRQLMLLVMASMTLGRCVYVCMLLTFMWNRGLSKTCKLRGNKDTENSTDILIIILPTWSQQRLSLFRLSFTTRHSIAKYSLTFWFLA